MTTKFLSCTHTIIQFAMVLLVGAYNFSSANPNKKKFITNTKAINTKKKAPVSLDDFINQEEKKNPNLNKIEPGSPIFIQKDPRVTQWTTNPENQLSKEPYCDYNKQDQQQALQSHLLPNDEMAPFIKTVAITCLWGTDATSYNVPGYCVNHETKKLSALVNYSWGVNDTTKTLFHAVYTFKIPDIFTDNKKEDYDKREKLAAMPNITKIKNNEIDTTKVTVEQTPSYMIFHDGPNKQSHYLMKSLEK